ncbi:hypothetical protein [Catenulispora pinisilvae]|uniref:hypothetical protein n=1 Tax=Catenulispora pinisilvae TaxID=2705253 RepID=UPI00189212B6|nr:hypothetical protein [Catenulispora pinisilvae]
MTDTVTPLATVAQLMGGPFADLFVHFDPDVVQEFLVDATRMCEDETDRRLALFTGLVESHRASGVDPDEYGDAGGIPIDPQGVVGASYAAALGTTSLIRHVYLDQYAPRYPEMWTYSDVQVLILRSFGGSQLIEPSRLVGPEPDSGHVWFPLGTYLPTGSLIRVTYSGGYATVPASLSRACRLMAAHLAVTELRPGTTQHDADTLRGQAVDILVSYVRPN